MARQSRRPLNVTIIEQLEPRRLCDGVTTLTIPFGDMPGAQAPLIHFKNANGVHEDITLSHGLASLTVSGTGLYTGFMGAKKICIYGDNITDTGISISDSSAATTFNFVTSGGNGLSTIPSFISSTPIGNIYAPKYTFTGSFNVGGLGQLTANKAFGASFDIGNLYTPKLGMNLRFGDLSDSSITAGGEVNLYAKTWTHTLTPGFITAPSLGNFQIGSSFNENLNITGGGDAIGKLFIDGVAGGNWNIQGKTDYMGAVSFGPNSNIINAGYVWNFKSMGDLSGNFSMGTTTNFYVGGNIDHATLKFTYPYTAGSYDLTKFTVKNSISYSYIISDGSAKSMSAGGISNSTLFFGANPLSIQYGALLQSSLDYASAASVGSLTLGKSGYQNSYFSAWEFGNLKLGNNLRLDNGGISYGFSSSQLGYLQARTDTNKTLILRDVPTQGSFSQQTMKQGINPRDFLVISVANSF